MILLFALQVLFAPYCRNFINTKQSQYFKGGNIVEMFIKNGEDHYLQSNIVLYVSSFFNQWNSSSVFFVSLHFSIRAMFLSIVAFSQSLRAFSHYVNYFPEAGNWIYQHNCTTNRVISISPFHMVWSFCHYVQLFVVRTYFNENLC